MSSGLSNSRHAHGPPPPPTTTPSGIPNTQQPPQPGPQPQALHPNLTPAKAELSRYTKIVRRLKWKLPFLSTAYGHATDRLGRDPAVVAEAELMFKLDFFEYYMLLERALVHLQSVFGISISRERAPAPSTAAGSGLGGSVWRDAEGGNNGHAQHRYHANVLAALDNPANPLHGVLGVGEVRRQLSRAKDLRNRWKTAGEDDDCEEQWRSRSRSPEKGIVVGPGGFKRARRMAAPLETYDLERILETIFDGFDRAFLVAERFVNGGEERGAPAEGPPRELEMTEEQEWEFMVDAMDWEAV
ncbi:hypothetical protein B0T16DRAFT_505648 [Cercophora newfieldiana]|uniref:Fungal specific transcription factor n=1 Tax=Cercophora newfieldiana TaxID=92897 RepID=A0AA39YHS3_9PEZI|nr:hypothetical protein B0T16DRAFT_505648 [Cercophora newfieldiana]